jgi:predicted metal-dependent hydrolase
MPYQLIRSKRKTLSLQIDKNAKLWVRAPIKMPLLEIEKFINQKQSWISQKQSEIKCRIIPKPQYKTGEFFLFLGEKYPLIGNNLNEKLIFNGQEFLLKNSFNALEAQTKFHDFYKKEFIKIALPRLEYYSKKHNLIFNQVRFKAQKTRWGSCSVHNNINLNYLLIMAPTWVIDMVIAHELVHIEHKNHSKYFYEKLTEIFPKHLQADIWLKQNAQTLYALQN